MQKRVDLSEKDYKSSGIVSIGGSSPISRHVDDAQWSKSLLISVARGSPLRSPILHKRPPKLVTFLQERAILAPPSPVTLPRPAQVNSIKVHPKKKGQSGAVACKQRPLLEGN